MTSRAAVLALTLAGIGCSNSPGDSVLTAHPQWEWQSACCGIGGNALTPATSGFGYVLQFDPTGTVRAIRNDSILVETRYRIEGSPGGPTVDPITIVEYDTALPLGPGVELAERHMIMVLENGALLLRNLASCADCFSDWEFLPSLAQ